ncbi:histidine kinase [Nonomuraea insulae]|uniref:histidine kinase n=1 Tax=Nonomuraea insulae TaxID=1616787 RepID=A0ABW1D2A4_9ACTN
MTGRIERAGRAVVESFGLALFRGDADPPPAARRLTFAVPRRLGAVVPLKSYNLVQVADLILAFVLYGLTLSVALEWNSRARFIFTNTYVGPQPVSELFVYLTAIGASLPVALRDRWPLAAWRVAAVLLPVCLWVTTTIGHSSPPYAVPLVIMYLLVLYSVAVRCDRRITLAIWTTTALAVWIIHPNSMPLVTVIASVALLFGYNVRVRRTATARLVEEERRTQQAEGAQAVLAERARIARELHDVVAHHMSVIAIQAEAVPLKAAGDPVQLEAGLSEIRALSLEAIAELRQVLGVLRDQDGRTDTAPQPGLDRIDELVSNARAAGLAVLVRQPASLGTLPQAVGLSAYRIVQESLSNVMRHAPGTTVAVDITREDNELRLRIANGPGDDMAPGPTPGTAVEAHLEPTGTTMQAPAQGPKEAATNSERQAEQEPTGTSRRRAGQGATGKIGRGVGEGPTEPTAKTGREAGEEPIEAGSRTGRRAKEGPIEAGSKTGHGAKEEPIGAGSGIGREVGEGLVGTAARAGRGGGQGLVGMRERAALLGGTLDAGPVAGGGFEVRATLPIAERESF